MIHERLPGQFNCTRRDDKGKPCLGLLKRFYPFRSYFNETDATRLAEITREFGRREDLMLYRCHDCQSLYKN